MVKHDPKCLLEVTNSSSHNLPNHMISSFANQTHHNQPPLYQKHMGTYCFNIHLNVFFLLKITPLQLENRLLNTTMALSSKIKRATRMYILRRYHLPAVAMCAMKISISGREFLHGDDTQGEMQIELHLEFDSDSNAESCLISTKTWTYLLRNRTPYSKKTEGANFEKPPPFKEGKRKFT